MKSLNLAEMLGTALSPVAQWLRLKKNKLFITYGMLLCELACVLLFLLKKHMFGVIVKPFISPLSFTAVANNWRPEPRSGPSAERPAAHRVGTAPTLKKQKIHSDISVPDWAISCCVFVCRHEDGTVRFWDASGVCLHPMYKLSTAGVFHTDTDPNDNMNQSTEGEWPLFRKVRLQQSAAANFLIDINLDFSITNTLLLREVLKAIWTTPKHIEGWL